MKNRPPEWTVERRRPGRGACYSITMMVLCGRIGPPVSQGAAARSTAYGATHNAAGARRRHQWEVRLCPGSIDGVAGTLH
jgi:hypothetical protein